MDQINVTLGPGRDPTQGQDVKEKLRKSESNMDLKC